ISHTQRYPTMTPASRTTWQRATRFCSISYKNAPRDHGIVNDARSMARTSSRSPARMGSTERGGTASKLRLRWSQIQWYEVGGADGLAQPQPLATEHAHARGRGHASWRREQPRVRRLDTGRTVPDEQCRRGQSGGELFGRQRKILPFAPEPVAVVAIERGVNLATPRLEHRANRQRGPRDRGGHRVWRGHGRDRQPQRECQAFGGAHADSQPRERARPDRHRQALEITRGPARIAEDTIHGGHETLRVRDADVEDILGDEPLAVHERHAAGQSGGLEGQHAHSRESSTRPQTPREAVR